MLLIADSGSTKTDWRVIHEDGKTVTTLQTQGLNPFFLTEEEIALIIKEQVYPEVGDVEKVFFYGAGCSLPQKAAQVKKAIDRSIPASLPAEVNGDILGAARSLMQNQSGICCILGTGANSCVYDGSTIIKNVPSLGFILADWGSGTVMSKDMLSLFLQEKLSEPINEDFRLTYALDRRQILDSIYNKPLANRFLASFTPFLLKYAEEPPFREVILQNFRSFFSYYVLGYGFLQEDIKLSITGSVAYHFKKYLLEVAGEMGIQIEKVVQHPIDGLAQYHSLTVPVSR
jgi:glucosamine kinase